MQRKILKLPNIDYFKAKIEVRNYIDSEKYDARNDDVMDYLLCT